MAEHRSEPGPDLEQDRDSALAGIGWDYPPWYCWAGVGGILYARRPKSNPPMIVRSATAEGLREAIEEADKAAGLRAGRQEQVIEDALETLREEFEGTGWRFGTVWASTVWAGGAGPGVRRLTASRRAVLLVAQDPAEMRAKLGREDPGEG